MLFQQLQQMFSFLRGKSGAPVASGTRRKSAFPLRIANPSVEGRDIDVEYVGDLPFIRLAGEMGVDRERAYFLTGDFHADAHHALWTGHDRSRMTIGKERRRLQKNADWRKQREAERLKKGKNKNRQPNA